MEIGVDLSVDFQTQTEGAPGYSHDHLQFNLEHDQAGFNTVEMADQIGEEVAPESVEPVEPYVGMEFDLLESAKEFYFNYAERLGFRVRASRFRTSRRDDSMIMRRFVCYKEGFCIKKEKGAKAERRMRGSMREGCMAMFEVVRNDHGRWVLAKLVTEHTHPLSVGIEARKPKRKRAVPSSPNLNSGEMSGRAVVRKRFSWGGGEAFSIMEYFKKMQERNPAFFYGVQIDEHDNSMVNVLWADPRARMAYSYFGDTVTLDSTFRKIKYMMPFVTFTGMNHHLQPVVFACAVLTDETEASLVWLLETFLIAMCRKHPVSFVTEQTEPLGFAVKKVFPRTRHRYCKWQIVSKCKEKLPHLCTNPTEKRALKRDLRRCIDDPKTTEEFHSSWGAFLHKYNLGDNVWMQSLYDVHELMATVFLRETFFAEMSPVQRSETMKKFFKRNFERKTSLTDFMQKFDLAMMGQYEKEVQADLANISTKPVLQTEMAIEKQAAQAYTKTIFSIFQEELVQSSSYSCSLEDNVDGSNRNYRVVLNGQDLGKVYMVSFSHAQKSFTCSCCKFEFSGVLCRHILRVFSETKISSIPDQYILQRWKKTAKSGPVLFESSIDSQYTCLKNITTRTNRLCVDVLKYASQSATSLEMYNVAKMALHRAYAEILASKKVQAS